jgi:hypothetical protein
MTKRKAGEASRQEAGPAAMKRVAVDVFDMGEVVPYLSDLVRKLVAARDLAQTMRTTVTKAQSFRTAAARRRRAADDLPLNLAENIEATLSETGGELDRMVGNLRAEMRRYYTARVLLVAPGASHATPNPRAAQEATA